MIGYFQSEKYFIDYSQRIRQSFTFKNKPDELNSEMLNRIKETESISLHIRRGDYVSNLTANSEHGLCSIDYYKKAVEYIKSKTESRGNRCFFLFSDDPIWVKENMMFLGDEMVVVDFNTGEKSYEDMRLMSMCKHNIIANSSFSWWAAWLNNNPDKIVIAPDKWFVVDYYDTCDLYPDNFIKI